MPLSNPKEPCPNCGKKHKAKAAVLCYMDLQSRLERGDVRPGDSDKFHNMQNYLNKYGL